MTSPISFQALPPLSIDEYAALEASILTHGVQIPIIVDENGVVIDGHHRQKITQEHGLNCPQTVRDGLSEPEKRTLALSLNIDRRHLSQEQKRALIAESLRADPQLSDREHGRRVGVHKDTVGSVRSELEESGHISHFSERVDPRTGRASQPASKPRPFSSPMNPSPDTIDEPPVIPPVNGHNGKTPAARTDPETLERYEQQRAAQISREIASKTVAQSVWLLASAAQRINAAAYLREVWQPHMDIYPEKTTAARMRAAADLLYELAGEWHQ